jgi:putative flippase GtrA
MIATIHRLAHSRAASAQFVRYLIIGSTVFCIDVGSFQILVRIRVLLVAAVTISYILGITTHFTLNRYWNFRVFERSIGRQARTYFIIALSQLPITIAIVEARVHIAKLSPLEAKVLAVAVNVPLSFLAHKYLTFGAGIRGTFKGLVR